MLGVFLPTQSCLPDLTCLTSRLPWLLSACSESAHEAGQLLNVEFSRDKLILCTDCTEVLTFSAVWLVSKSKSLRGQGIEN